MARVQHDDVDAFACLYDRHAARAFRVACSVCPDAGSAEDAVQEGFLAIWRGRMDYRTPSGSFSGWAMAIMRHRAIDIARGASTRPKLADPARNGGAERPDPSAAAPPDALIARERADRLRASLRRLPQAQAEVIALAFFGELSHTEIARLLTLPPGTVKGRMRLGLSKLREEVAPTLATE